MKAIMERVGFKQDWHDQRVYHSRARRVEVCWKWGGPRLSLSCFDSEHLTFIVGLVVVTVYVKVKPFFKLDYRDVMELGYGFYVFEDALVFELGRRRAFLRFPWSWDFYKRWEWVDGYGPDDGAWFEVPRRGRYDAVASKHVHDYAYVLKSGEVQRRKATVSRNRMEWRWRWFKWLPYPRKVSTCIWVNFDEEVGEQTGSYKGGTVGCGYEVRPGETPLATLRRMERERKFT